MSILSIAGVLSLGAGGGATPLARAYWRVQGSPEGMTPLSGSGNKVSYSAMAFRDTSGSSIPASGGTAIQSSSTTGASALFDGTDATYWLSSDLTAYVAWAGYQFASPVSVGQIGLQKTSGMTGNPGLYSEFQYSSDGVTWFPIAAAEPALALTSNDTMVWFDFTLNTYITRTSFGSHAYWRVCGSQEGLTQRYVAYSAMAFRDAGGSTITVSGGSVIESGHFSTFSASSLFDGTDATFWESTNSDGVSYAGYHFGSAVEVMQIGLQKTSLMDGSFPAALALFQYSDDGVNWVTAAVADVSAALTANDTMVWFNFAGGL